MGGTANEPFCMRRHEQVLRLRFRAAAGRRMEFQEGKEYYMPSACHQATANMFMLIPKCTCTPWRTNLGGELGRGREAVVHTCTADTASISAHVQLAPLRMQQFAPNNAR